MGEKIAVIGAGVIGCAVAFALAREGHRVDLIDRAAPANAGASFGNVGHIAAELVQPLPSRALVFGFWRELYAFGGALDVPLKRLPAFAPWAIGFARAAWRREKNTRALAPLVRPAAAETEQLLRAVGRGDLIRRNGHYQVWFGAAARRRADAEADDMRRHDIPVQAMEHDVLQPIASAAGATHSAGLWFPDSAHVLDPQHVAQAFADAARAAGTQILRGDVRTLARAGSGVIVHTAEANAHYDAAVVCAGPWSAPLLAPFGLRAPLEAAHGYHVELAGHDAVVPAPLVYVDSSVLVTPMAGRLRASSYMEFAALGAAPDARKPQRLRRRLAQLGYRCDADGPSWHGARPVLPDYLPGIGRAPGEARVFYAIGHQHIGLTLAPITAELIAALVCARTPRHDVAAFDLRRFGSAA